MREVESHFTEVLQAHQVGADVKRLAKEAKIDNPFCAADLPFFLLGISPNRVTIFYTKCNILHLLPF